MPSILIQQGTAQINMPDLPPEILSKIFSYLTSYQTRRWVLPVCKLWNTFGRISIIEVVVNNWNRGEGPREASQVKAKELLHSGTDILYCHDDLGPQINGLVPFIENLSRLSMEKRRRIKTIVLSVDWTFNKYWNDLLPVISHVQVLKLTAFQDVDTIEIDIILRQLPSLLELRIIPSEHTYGCQDTFPRHLIRFKDQDTPIPRLILRSFTLWRVGVDFDDLFKILYQCPSLVDLRLAEIFKHVGSPPNLTTETEFKSFREIDIASTEIFKEIRNCCPMLQNFHFSSPEVLWNRARLEGFNAAFPKLNSLSFISHNDGHLAFDFLKNYASLTLTKLEVLKSGFANRVTGLQEFLCSTPNLIHLDILGVELSDKDLIVLEDYLPQFPCIIGEPTHASKSLSLYDKRIWACRKLQTLRVKYRQDVDCPRPLYFNRGFFAFIVHVCPQLKNLTIYLDSFNYSMETGFCLLSGLERLVKLEVYNFHQYRREHISTYNETEHLDWFSTNGDVVPWAELSMLRRIEWVLSMKSKRFSNESRLDKDNFVSTSGDVQEEWLDSNCRMIYRIQKASCFESVIDVLDNLRRSKERCWPMLESMRFSYWHQQTIKILRPELDHSDFGSHFYHRDYCNNKAHNYNNCFDVE